MVGAPLSSARAQVDMAVLQKWSAAAVVRYAVVGVYDAETAIVKGSSMARMGRVTDRFDLTFDWNQNETSLVGTPTFRNSPSTATEVRVAGCPPVRMDGSYEHISSDGKSIVLTAASPGWTFTFTPTIVK
jgi:hypothetical protein